jgi:hypothetical protein
MVQVRRSAVRVVRAIVTTRAERLEWLCGNCCDVLVSRFKVCACMAVTPVSLRALALRYYYIRKCL